LWLQVVRNLDIETIAPQHGAIMKGRHIVNQFLDWLEDLEAGLDLMDPIYKLPTNRLQF
jgi:flavorubredoxin